MKKDTKKRLEQGGWAVGNASDFLGLSPAEEALIEIRLALGDEVRASRERTNLTQKALAKLIGSSQSRIAKIESGDPSVSIDLQMKALFTAGSRPGALLSTLGRKLAARPHRAAYAGR
jgi:DNA-binding XRE family transcriptional regulator